MRKLKVAILEDDIRLLLDLAYMVKDLNLADIVVKSKSSDDFINQVELQKPDVLFLDIDLNGDSMNGVDVCNRLNLPTLFISGKTKEYLHEIEEIKIYNNHPIDFLLKPVREEKLKLVFGKFLKMIAIQNGENTHKVNPEFLVVKTREANKHSIKIDSIAYLDTKTDDGNRIFLNSGEVIETPRGKFSDFLNKLPPYFLKINKSTIINAKMVDQILTSDEVSMLVGKQRNAFFINAENKEKLLEFRPEFR
jgi:DNA-binding LytR/AlgR family response regulator